MITEYTQLLSACTRNIDGKSRRLYNLHTNKFQNFNFLPGEDYEWSEADKKWIYSIKNPEYLLSHEKVPLTLWLMESLDHWLWLKSLTIELYNEYKFRYGDKQHRSGEIALVLNPPKLLKSNGFSAQPLAMPDGCKILLDKGTADVVGSYRQYYNMNKKHIAKWTGRNQPEWYNGQN